MYKRKEFKTTLEAIKYIKDKHIEVNRLLYIASKRGICELVYRRK